MYNTADSANQLVVESIQYFVLVACVTLHAMRERQPSSVQQGHSATSQMCVQSMETGGCTKKEEQLGW
jgi:hypothetical protein